MEKHPELLRRIVAEGHEVGNHTYSHLFVYFKSRRRIAGGIDRTQAIIEKVIGFRPKSFGHPMERAGLGWSRRCWNGACT